MKYTDDNLEWHDENELVRRLDVVEAVLNLADTIDDVIDVIMSVPTYIADRKTESNSEKPNNFKWSVEYAKEMLDTMSCEECGHWEHGAGDHYYCALLAMRQECCFESKGESTLMFANKPKDEPTTQTETQNSNLTFKTLEYCDICDHEGCEECIANALDEHCMPSQFNKQIEDECAKEYEELGLKELKELIKADRKDEPQTDCYMCKWLGEVDVCGRCRNRNLFAEADTEPKPKDEPKTQTETQNSNLTFEKADEFELFEREDLILLIECQKERIAELLAKDEPQTDVYEYQNGEWVKPDCPWK